MKYKTDLPVNPITALSDDPSQLRWLEHKRLYISEQLGTTKVTGAVYVSTHGYTVFEGEREGRPVAIIEIAPLEVHDSGFTTDDAFVLLWADAFEFNRGLFIESTFGDKEKFNEANYDLIGERIQAEIKRAFEQSKLDKGGE